MASYRHPIEENENNLNFESSHLVENFHGQKKLSSSYFSLSDLIVEVQAAAAVASSSIQTFHLFLLVRSL